MKSQSNAGVWTILLFAVMGCVFAAFGVVPQQWFREVFGGASRSDQQLIVGLLLIVIAAVILAIGHVIEKRKRDGNG